MDVQPLENTALSWGTIRKSACILAEITYRKSQSPLPRWYLHGLCAHNEDRGTRLDCDDSVYRHSHSDCTRDWCFWDQSTPGGHPLAVLCRRQRPAMVQS